MNSTEWSKPQDDSENEIVKDHNVDDSSKIWNENHVNDESNNINPSNSLSITNTNSSIGNEMIGETPASSSLNNSTLGDDEDESVSKLEETTQSMLTVEQGEILDNIVITTGPVVETKEIEISTEEKSVVKGVNDIDLEHHQK